MLKLKMMPAHMLPLVVVGCTSAVFVSRVKPLLPPAWIMQPPRLADTAERDYFTPRGRSLCKNNRKEPRSITNDSAGIERLYRWASMQLL